MLDFLRHVNLPLVVFIVLAVALIVDKVYCIIALWIPLQRLHVRLFPKSASAHYWLGCALGSKSFSEECESELRQAIALKPWSRDAYNMLLYVLVRKPSPSEDLPNACKEMWEQFPDDPYAYLMLGRWHQNSGRPHDAEQAYRKAIELAPRFDQAYESLAWTLMVEDRVEEAEAIYDQHRDVLTRNTEMYYLSAAKALRNNGEYDSALVALQNAIRKSPKNASTYNRLGVLLREDLGRFDDAEKAYRKAIELEPRSEHGYNAYIGLGWLLLNQLKRHAEAEDAFRAAIAIDASRADAYCCLGAVHEQRNRPDEAEREYRMAIEHAPDQAMGYECLGNLLAEGLNRFEEAENAHRKAIELAPDQAVIHINLGNLLHEKLGRFDEAEQAYRKGIELDPKIPDGYQQLGLLLLEHLHRYAEAEVLFQKALELRPDDETGLYNVACAKTLQKDSEGALDYLRKAIEKGFDRAWAWNDPDLEALRADPRFVEIVGERPEPAVVAEEAVAG